MSGLNALGWALTIGIVLWLAAMIAAAPFVVRAMVHRARRARDIERRIDEARERIRQGARPSEHRFRP